MKFIAKDKALSKLSLVNPIHFLALGFGSGLAAKAPGTFGTLAAIPVYLLLSQLSLFWYITVIFLAFILGIYICGKTSNDMEVHDHGAIVWDEVVGYLVTMIAAPSGWQWVIIGFVLFRLFDILKPWPIRVLDEKVHGGLGIIIDDVFAGFCGLICIQIMAFYC